MANTMQPDPILDQIKGDLARLSASGDQSELNKWFATNQYTPEQMAAASGYNVADVQKAQKLAQQAYGTQATPQATSTVTTSPADDWMAGAWYNSAATPSNFDWRQYVAANQDLATAGIDTPEEAARHYDLYGRQENRSLGTQRPTYEQLSRQDMASAREAFFAAHPEYGFIISGTPQADYFTKWQKENWLPTAQLKTDYTKPTFDPQTLLSNQQVTNRPPEQLASIREFWEQNKDDPFKVAQAMRDHNVSLGDLSQATGESYGQLNQWVQGAGPLAMVGFDIKKPGSFEKYKKTTTPMTPEQIMGGPTVAGPVGSLDELRRSYEARTARAPGTFDYEAYKKGIAALAQQTAPRAPVGGLSDDTGLTPKEPLAFKEQATPKAPVGESRTEQQKAPTGTLQERATTFGDTFKSLTSDPTKTEYDVKKYLDTIRQDKDLMKAYGNKLDPYFAYYDKVPEYKGDAADYLTKQLQNQQGAGTAQYWKSGLDTDTATKYMADTMRKYGLKDINQLGVKEVEVPEHTETIEGESGPIEQVVPASTKKVFFNKATGEEITGRDIDADTGQFGKTYAGKGNTAFRVQFNKETGKPIFYTTQQSSSDLGDVAPLLAMASFIPGVAPFAQGLNALIAAKQGNIAGALLSGLGAAGGIGQLAGASPEVLSGLKTARDVVGVANAIQNKDILGLVSSGAQLGGVDLGATKIAGDITAKDAMFGAAAVKAFDNKDYASLLNIAAQMSKSDDLKTAAKGIMVADAIKSNNPAKVVKVLGSLATQETREKKPRTEGAQGGLLQGPGFVTVPDNAAVDHRVFSGIASPLLVGDM